MIQLLFVLFALAVAQSWDVTTFYTDASCVISRSRYIGYSAVPHVVSCTNSTCFPIGSTYYLTECARTVLPEDPEDAIRVDFYAQEECRGQATGEIFTITADACFAYPDPQAVPPFSVITSAKGDCHRYTKWNNGFCRGVGVDDPSLIYGNGCFNNPGTGSGYTSSCKSVCFHEETLISYEGKAMTLAQIQDEKACSIPHVVKANGVKIQTTCEGSLRLTNDHLVYTQSGLKTAASVKVGDFLYNDLDEKKVCEVVAVDTETLQQYFGLNCEESIVLANGYKTSTFGVTHDLPAIWMKYASKVFGVQVASSLGDMVANLLVRWIK